MSPVCMELSDPGDCRGPSGGWAEAQAGPAGLGLAAPDLAAACREAGWSPRQVGLAARSLSHVLSLPGLLIWLLLGRACALCPRSRPSVGQGLGLPAVLLRRLFSDCQRGVKPSMIPAIFIFF